jgi:hypothetical protein
MSATRYIIEGEWSGYVAGQEKVVHRAVYPAHRKMLRAWAEKTRAIAYPDGTRLVLSVRECKPRERVHEIHGYTSLIEDCSHYSVCSVQALQQIKAQRGVS